MGKGIPGRAMALVLSAGMAMSSSVLAEQGLPEQPHEPTARPEAPQAGKESAGQPHHRARGWEHAWYALVEVEADGREDFDGSNSGDLVLAKAKLGFQTQVNTWLGGRLLLLHEHGGPDLEIDEAVITLTPRGLDGGYLDVGRQYLPFGRYETHLVSDSLVQELAETRETALVMGRDNDALHAAVWLSSGDTGEAMSNGGFNIGLARELQSLWFDAGLGYITSLGDSDRLQERVGEADRVPGYSVYAGFGVGPFTITADYVSATGRFDAAYLEHMGRGARPSGHGVEAGYTFELAGYETTVAAAVQGTREAQAPGLPRTRRLVGMSMDLGDHLAVGLEYSRGRDYKVGEGGTGRTANAFVVQLAAEF
jgi:hypothetical protein